MFFFLLKISSICVCLWFFFNEESVASVCGCVCVLLVLVGIICVHMHPLKPHFPSFIFFFKQNLSFNLKFVQLPILARQWTWGTHLSVLSQCWAQAPAGFWVDFRLSNSGPHISRLTLATEPAPNSPHVHSTKAVLSCCSVSLNSAWNTWAYLPDNCILGTAML